MSDNPSIKRYSMPSDTYRFTCPKCRQKFGVKGMDVVSVRCPCGHTFKPKNAQTSILMTVACLLTGLLSAIVGGLTGGLIALVIGQVLPTGYIIPICSFIGFCAGVEGFRRAFPGKVRIR